MEINKYWDRTDIASGIGMSACGRTSSLMAAIPVSEGDCILAATQPKTKGHVGLAAAFTTVPGTNAWSPPVC